MHDENSLNHTKWECKYHIVWIPKYRRKVLYGKIRDRIGEELRRLARNRECEILEGYTMPDHIHILMAVPPKHSVSSVMGYIKGKSAIYIARRFCGRERNFAGQSFWARGYYKSKVLRARSGTMRSPCGSISGTKRTRRSNWICLNNNPL